MNRDPSYPDRERIDSDVRAFLRPASSPWIVFDRDSRADDFATSALRLGKVFASSPSFVEDSSGDVVSSVPLDRPITEPPKAPTRSDAPPLPPPTIDPSPVAASAATPAVPKPDAFAAGAVLSHAMSSVLPSTGVFPTSTTPSEAVVEPSNLVVAADVIPDESSSDLSTPSVVARSSRRRLAFVAGASACVLAIAGAAVLAVGGRVQTKAAAAPQAPEAAAVVQADAPAPVVDPPAPTLELDPVAPPTAETPSDEATPSKPEKKSQFGKLTIKSDAKHKNVYFDGKRMLGTGQRTFLVYCGKHTIAVNDKADAKEVEIPCSGEYVVSK